MLLAAFSTAYFLFRPSSTKMLTTLTVAIASAAIMTPGLCEKPVDPELSRNLRAALTRVDFLNQLAESDLVYDFSKVIPDPYHPGSVLNANAATFPLMLGSGMTVAQLNLGPCAMLAPHSHPRAHNVVIAVSGSTKTYMRAENGAKDVTTTLTPGKMTMFWGGSLHAMVNEGCNNNLLYSFLNSDDAGTLNLAQAFWAVGQDIAQQVMPMIHVDDKKDWNETGKDIPDWGLGSQEGTVACRKFCGLLD